MGRKSKKKGKKKKKGKAPSSSTHAAASSSPPSPLLNAKAPSELNDFWCSALSGAHGRARVEAFLREASATAERAARVGVPVQQVRASIDGLCEPFEHDAVKAELERLLAMQQQPLEGVAAAAAAAAVLQEQELEHDVEAASAEAAEPTVRSAGQRKRKKRKGKGKAAARAALLLQNEPPRFMTVGSVPLALLPREGVGADAASAASDDGLNQLLRPASALRAEQIEALLETALQDPAQLEEVVTPANASSSSSRSGVESGAAASTGSDGEWSDLESGWAQRRGVELGLGPGGSEVELREASGWRAPFGRGEESEPLLGGRHSELTDDDWKDAAVARAAADQMRTVSSLSSTVNTQRTRTEEIQSHLSDEQRRQHHNTDVSADKCVVWAEHRQFQQKVTQQAMHIDAWFSELEHFMEVLFELETHMPFCSAPQIALKGKIIRQALEMLHTKTVLIVNDLFKERRVNEKKFHSMVGQGQAISIENQMRTASSLSKGIDGAAEVVASLRASALAAAAAGHVPPHTSEDVAVLTQERNSFERKTRRLYHETNGHLIAELGKLHDQVEKMRTFIAPHVRNLVTESAAYDVHLKRVRVDKRIAGIEEKWLQMRDAQAWTNKQLEKAMSLIKQQKKQKEPFNFAPLHERCAAWKAMLFATKQSIEQWGSCLSSSSAAVAGGVASVADTLSVQFERKWRNDKQKEGSLEYELAFEKKRLAKEAQQAQQDRNVKLAAGGMPAVLERRLKEVSDSNDV